MNSKFIRLTVDNLNKNYFISPRFSIPGNGTKYVEYGKNNIDYYLVFNLNKIVENSLNLQSKLDFHIESCIIEYANQFIEVMTFALQFQNIHSLILEYDLYLENNQTSINYSFYYEKIVKKENIYLKDRFIKSVTTQKDSFTIDL